MLIFNSIADFVQSLTTPNSKLELESRAEKVLKVQLFELKHILESQANLPCYYEAARKFNQAIDMIN